MKPGASSLNPYAASYIPLARRDANDHIKAKDVEHGNETSWFEYASHYTHNPHYNNASLDSVTPGAEKTHFAEASVQKNNDPNMDVEFDMDLEYLRMTFPGLSNESILDVYLANNEDLEATVDMLNQLEMRPECSGTLPDTLDIGDVSEPGSAAHCSSLKLKNVAGETIASSSGSAQSDVAS
ncbi:CTC-interacting domain 5, putative isoform 2 [Hibiscus syriacus]|uniref:CTC-interacting domain 5, putative isoform 2 n=1 Tax=Hibiscus syriacus TaxID=106335 RepID=A0A6A2W9E1_HIBSY|nr:polyadenylate-binding protein-interacting protein 5-like [Hibiscus syriacus]KAE8654493.1 CTC-interacting domain 5, putative isoform 2 [Hibiscus syriacus]